MEDNKEIVEVLTIIDEKNKIYYIEYQLFDKNSIEKQQAMLDMVHLKEEAKRKGYTIIKRDNGISPTIYNENENLNYSSRVMDDFLNNLDDLMNQNDNKESSKRKI